ncbi:MAG: hypothetical protein ACRELY_09235 [Polyangiaceae bacterium]
MSGGVRKRWWMASAAIGALACSPLVACTGDGTTPDCTSPEAGCGPDLTATDEGGEAEAAAPKDAQVVDSFVADTGPGDASNDADAHD